MRNLAFRIRFNGARYHGFQVQKNAVTVAGVFQDALSKVIGAREDIKGCSRTDAGVHANDFCVSLKTRTAISAESLVMALNAQLPYDIAVISCAEVDPGFHARYSCIKKSYLYKVYNCRVRNPFLHGLAFHCRHPLNDIAMNEAAGHFVGVHDFSAFSADKTGKDSVREIYGSRVWREADMIFFEVEGSGFLYNMVRIMAGTLFYVGAGKTAPNDMPRIIASKDRAMAGVTAPPHGLYLNKVVY